MPLDYNDIEDYKFNPFTKTKYYTAITDESYIIPSSPIYGGYLIWLYHAPRETVPSSVSITIGGVPLLEVSSAPANMQYRVYYDEEGCGCIEFNSNQKGLTALVSYSHYGTFNSKAFAQAIYDAFYSGNSQISGITIANNSLDADNDLDFGAGSVHNTVEKLRVALSAMTKKLDSAWSIGNNGGMLDTGSIGASSDYYLYLIGKNTDPTAGDILASLNATTPTLPPTWTNYTLIGICQTDSSSKIRQGQWRRNGNEIEFRFKNFIIDRAWAACGSASRVLVALTVPPNSHALTHWFVPITGAYGSCGETFEADVAPVGIPTSKFYGTDSYQVYGEHLKTDANKQIFFRFSNTTTWLEIKTLGWKITL